MDQYLRRISLHPEKTLQWSQNEYELKCKITYKEPPISFKDGSNSNDTTTYESKPVTKFVSNYEELNAFRKSIEERRVIQDDDDDDDDDDVFEEKSMRESGYSLDDETDATNLKLQPPKSHLKYLMREMVSHHINTNVQVAINNVYINCHLCVLQIFSKFFLDIEHALVITLPPDKVSMKAFMAIYQWMLADNPKISRKDIAAVYLAGSYLHIDELLDHCWSYFDSDSYFSEDAAGIFYVETAVTPALDVVSNTMLMRIKRFFLPFVASSHFLELPIKHLIYLLNTQHLGVNSEVEVFYAAVRWLEHKWDERHRKIFKLFKHIQYKLMPGWFLLSLPNSRETTTIHYIMSIRKMSLIVHQAIADVTVFMYDGLMETKFEEGTIERVLTEHSVDKRLWIEDKSCHFHHHISCTEMPEFRYVDFLGYLQKLQLMGPNYWMKALKPIDRTTSCCERNKLFQIAEK